MTSKRVGVLGSGTVAQVLAGGFKKHGYEVTIGSRDPGKLAEFGKTRGVAVGDFAQAAAAGEVVVLAVKGTAALEALKLAGDDHLKGKIVIDTTNPIAEGPPQNGMLRYFTGPNDSLMERLQAAHPDARFVKAWSSVGNAFMVNPQFPGGTPTMFICGNDAAAKAEVSHILRQFGWDSEDMGLVEGARAIEPLCQLWCAPGFLRNQWTHAFKLLKL
jgi:predicted dinucleotide-binding enzyme